jgi:hypothetical protein
MAKTKSKAKPKKRSTTNKKPAVQKTATALTNKQADNLIALFKTAKRDIDMTDNATSLMRSTLLNKLIDPRRDIDLECGYPKELTTEQYKIMYDREGIASRVVSIFPEESWVNDPEVRENEDPKATEFEEAWMELEEEKQLWSNLMKADELSGIGKFGIVLLGLNDGKTLDKPVEGIDEKGEKVGNIEYKLLYIRVFSEAEVSVKTIEKDVRNPRFGKPTSYSVTFDTSTTYRNSTGQKTSTSISQEQTVHWSRVIHIADNRKSSEVYGVPRMQKLFNRLYDLRKILGGSGEMFWKGGFPGYSFEMDPNARALTAAELETLKETLAEFANGLQRYLATQGVSAKSLATQLANPKGHVEVQLEVIAIVLGVPKRIFMGAEQAKLASSQDTKSWNKRIGRRQKKYLTPYVIRPLIDRLIAFGVLPEAQYSIFWPDLDAPSDFDKAEVLDKQVDAFSKYIKGDVNALIPEEIFLSMLVGFSPEQIEKIMKAVVERERDMEDEEEARQLEEEEEEETEE